MQAVFAVTFVSEGSWPRNVFRERVFDVSGGGGAFNFVSAALFTGGEVLSSFPFMSEGRCVFLWFCPETNVSGTIPGVVLDVSYQSTAPLCRDGPRC